jgi:hypothetical protein
MTLSLSAEGVTHLEGGRWQTTAAYRFLHAEDGYVGDRFDPTYARTIGARINIHSFDLQTTYGFTSRYSLTLTVPFVSGGVSSFRDHENDGIHRHTMSASGLGDARFLGNAWLLDPNKHRDGNISVSLGVKAPTGRLRAHDIAYRPTGQVLIPVDIALQPGDGGWGMVVETVAYQKLFTNAFAYGSGFYLFNPREKNGAVTTLPVYGEYRNLSVPDQYMGRVGLNYALLPQKGVSASFGGRIDGIPSRDVFGGSERLSAARRGRLHRARHGGLAWRLYVQHLRSYSGLSKPDSQRIRSSIWWPRCWSVCEFPDHLRRHAPVLTPSTYSNLDPDRSYNKGLDPYVPSTIDCVAIAASSAPAGHSGLRA